MPNELFNKISKEKQDNFINAAISEFTSKSIEDVSILSISKVAGISRGTFYNYFDDIDSLFKYVFNTVKVERAKHAKIILEEGETNFFEFVKKLLLYDYDSYMELGRYSLFSNYIRFVRLNLKSVKEEIIDPIFMMIDQDIKKSGLLNFEKYKVNQSEFFEVVEMLMIVLVDILIHSQQKGRNKEETKGKINFAISIFEYGVIK